MIYVIGEKNQKQTLQLVEKALEISEQLPEQSVSLLYVDVEKIQFSYEITDYFENKRADYILLPSTPLFRETAAEMTVKLSAALLTDCISLSFDNGILTGIRPSLDGKSFSHYAFSNEQTSIIVVKDTGITEPRQDLLQNCAKVVELSAAAPVAAAENMPVNAPFHTDEKRIDLPATSGETVFVRKIFHENVSKDIKDAQLIFAGGRGLMNEQSFEALRKLADIFDASIGASRPVVDCGWADPSEQVGQTGSFVHPKVYLAFGISGAIQHLAGMKNSQCIIAVNNNQNSPIFQYCDYGIRADANSIIRNLLQILQAEN